MPAKTDCSPSLPVVVMFSPASADPRQSLIRTGVSLIAARRTIASVAGWWASSSIFGDRLRQNPEADHRIANHEDKHGALTSQCHVVRAKVP